MFYTGGKGGCYQRFINLMPSHDTYIETHLGGGAVLRYKRPAKRNIGIEIDSDVIEKWKNNAQPCIELIHGDAVNFLKSHKFTGKELVYCDPPYLRETRKKYYPLYKHEYSLEQHIELLEVLKSIRCMIMISGYESSLYKSYLKGWSTHCFQAKTHNGMATEWIWMNYSQPKELHDYRYLGNNYRERYLIKHKLKNWVRRLKSIPTLERQALLSAVRGERQ
jgi:DNA adenine methylase